MCFVFQNLQQAKTECLQLVSLAYTQIVVRSDGGRHQKHLLGANEAMHAVLTSCRRLLFKPVQMKTLEAYKRNADSKQA